MSTVATPTKGADVDRLIAQAKAEEQQRHDQAEKEYHELEITCASIDAGANLSMPSTGEINRIVAAVGRTLADLQAYRDRSKRIRKFADDNRSIPGLKSEIDSTTAEIEKDIQQTDEVVKRHHARVAELRRKVDQLETKRAAAHSSRAKLGQLLPLTAAEKKLQARKEQLANASVSAFVMKPAEVQAELTRIDRELTAAIERKIDEFVFSPKERLAVATASEKALLADREKLQAKIVELTALAKGHEQSMQSGDAPSAVFQLKRTAIELEKAQTGLAEIERRLAVVCEQKKADSSATK